MDEFSLSVMMVGTFFRLTPMKMILLHHPRVRAQVVASWTLLLRLWQPGIQPSMAQVSSRWIVVLR